MSLIAAVILAAVVAQGAAQGAGDAAFAKGDFQTAFTEYNDAIIRNPSDADAILGLGTLDLYRNDWKNARTYLQRARKLAPNDPRVEARIAVLEERLPQTGRYTFELQNGRADIPLVASSSVPVVKATIGGRSFTLLVDTSAGSIDLNASSASALGLANGGLIPAIQFPGLTVTNVPVTVASTPIAAGATPVDGAIGTVFLSHFVPTFDFAQNRLTLRRWEDSPSIERAAKVAGAAVEPMWLVGDRLLVTSQHGESGTAQMFAIETGNAAGMVAATNDRFAAVPFYVAGTLGNAFFRPATLTLDFAAMNVIVAK